MDTIRWRRKAPGIGAVRQRGLDVNGISVPGMGSPSAKSLYDSRAEAGGAKLQELHMHSENSRMEIGNSWPNKWRRRWHFYVRYYRAKTRWSTFRRLEPLIKKHFESHIENGRNDWISHVAVRLRALPGIEDRELRVPWPGDRSLLRLRFFPWREQGCSAYWGSPVTVLVFKKGKDGGKPVAVRYMSLFVEDDVIHIAQMQGARKIEMPPGLKDWAERLLQACMEFAKAENFRGVRVGVAQAQHSFHHPYVQPLLSAEERVRETDRIRERMRSHLDGSAHALGWPLVGEWFEWNNPQYRQDGQQTRDRRRRRTQHLQ
jgi:hypothetical protein